MRSFSLKRLASRAMALLVAVGTAAGLAAATPVAQAADKVYPDSNAQCVAGTWVAPDPNTFIDPATTGRPLHDQTEHFAFYWADSWGYNVDQLNASGAKETLEKYFSFYTDPNGMNWPTPDCNETTKHKIAIFIQEPPNGGLVSSVATNTSNYQHGYPAMFMLPANMSDKWGMAHEFGHTFQFAASIGTGRWVNGQWRQAYGDGGQWIMENVANWMAFHATGENNPHCTVLRANNPNIPFGSARDRYCDWPFLEYVTEKLGMPTGMQAVSNIWRRGMDFIGQGVGLNYDFNDPMNPIQVMRMAMGLTQDQFNDLFGEWAMRQTAFDYPYVGRESGGRTVGQVMRDGFDAGNAWGNPTDWKADDAQIRVNRFAYLDPVDGVANRYKILPSQAPGQDGFNMVPIDPQAGVSSFTVDFHGIVQNDPNTTTWPAGTNFSDHPNVQTNPDSDWRWGVVTVRADGTPEYSTLRSGADGTLTVNTTPGAQGYYLVVTGTPKTMQTLLWEQKDYSQYRYPYFVDLKGATARQMSSTVAGQPGWHQHPNGGGWVSDSAHVDNSVYVGPNARVYGGTITGNARIEDHATILNGNIRDNAVIKGISVVLRANTEIYGNAVVDTNFQAVDFVAFSGLHLGGDAKVLGAPEWYTGKTVTHGVYYGLVDDGVVDGPYSKLGPNDVTEITRTPTAADYQANRPVTPDPGQSGTITSLTVSKLPTKVEYTAGDGFDPAGIEVLAVMSDKSTRKLAANEYTISTPDMNKVGRQTLKVTLNADPKLEALFDINVNAKAQVPDLKPGAGNVAPDASVSASYTNKSLANGGADALRKVNDGVAQFGDDPNVAWNSWGDDTNTEPWVQLTWPQKMDLTKAGLYFWTDNGGVPLPGSWRLQYADTNGAWKDVALAAGSSYAVNANAANEVSFDKVSTDKLRVVFAKPTAPNGVGVTEFAAYGAKTPEVKPADTTKPVFKGVDDVTVKYGASFDPLAGVSASDDVDGDVTSKIKVSGDTVDTTAPGYYSVVYTVTDKAGNKASAQRIVEVEDKPVEPSPVPVASIDVAGAQELTVGDSAKLTATVKPADAADKSLTWSSADDKVATVAQDGTVTAVSEGTVLIFASAKDGSGVRGHINLTIKAKAQVPDLKPGAGNVAPDASVSASYTNKSLANGGADALRKVNDGVAQFGDDPNVAWNSWGDDTNTEPWVQLTWPQKMDLTKAGLYFWTDNGGVPLPGSWRLQYADTNGAWKDVALAAGSSYAVNANAANEVSFDKVSTDKLRVVFAKPTAPNGVGVTEFAAYGTKTPEAPKSHDATLKSLSVAGQPVDLNAADLSVTVDDPDKVLPSDVVAQTTDKDAIAITSVENGVAKVEVTAADGTTKKTYTVKLVRKVVPDTTKPVIKGASDVTVEFGADFDAKAGVTANDDRDGDLTGSIKVEGTVDTKKAGDYTLTYTVSDKAGNKATAVRKVTVKPQPVQPDTTAPTFKGVSDVTVDFGAKFEPLAGVKASDDRDGDLTAAIKVEGSVDTSKAGDYTLTYTVSDAAGNKTKVTRKVTVKPQPEQPDTVKPVISGATDVTVEYGAQFEPLAGVKATDDKDGDVTAAIKVSGTVDTSKAGDYTLTYTVSDKAGNKATAVRKVTVKPQPVQPDTTKPVISGAADVTVEFGSDFDAKAGVTANDDKDGDLTKSIQVSGSVDTRKAGDYTLTYTVSDKAGNTASVTRKVTVKEAVPECAPLTFSDVTASTPHQVDIDWLACRGISTGWKQADGTSVFSPMGVVIRQDMAAFLYRLAGKPAFDETKAVNPFVDVTPATPHYKEILWLASTGISQGFRNADGLYSFGGDRAVVRQDMAAFLHKLAIKQGKDVASGQGVTFTDLAGASHADDIQWLAKTGVTTGWKSPDGKTAEFRGMNVVVRQDMAAFLHRMDTNVLNPKQ